MNDWDFLITNGYVILRNAIPVRVLEWCRDRIQPLLAHQPNELDTYSVGEEPLSCAVLELASEALLRRLGFAHIHSIGPTLINKKPKERARPWHHDWRWAHLAELSADPVPTQVGVVFYLRDTNEENGCLRVLPGSHLSDCEHDRYSRGTDSIEGEISLPTGLGDVLIFDSRLRHSTHANRREEPREAVNMWQIVREGFSENQPTLWQVRKAEAKA